MEYDFAKDKDSSIRANSLFPLSVAASLIWKSNNEPEIVQISSTSVPDLMMVSSVGPDLPAKYF